MIYVLNPNCSPLGDLGSQQLSKPMKRKIIIASRKSDLARIQAHSVGEALLSLEPSLQIAYQFSSSLGDRQLDLDLRTIEEKGIFTQDLHEQLIKGQIDLAIHSWKDLPVELPQGTEVMATLPREDMRDLLLIPKNYLYTVKEKKRLEVLSSSPRREYNLQTLIPRIWPHELHEVKFNSIRGNIPTRLDKLFNGEPQALILAKAAIDRILSTKDNEFRAIKEKVWSLINECQWMVLPLRENPCAPAQGALAIETRRGFLETPLKALNCEETYRNVSKERNILASYGGGCHQKIGVSILTKDYGEIYSLRGLTESGRTLQEWTLSEVPSKEKLNNESSLPPDLPQKKFHGKAVNYHDPLKNTWFDREFLPLKNTHFDRPLWVAKDIALPQDATCSQLVWASGIKTWEKLAQRGYWVNGCAESLGERENPRLEHLSGQKIDWLKLTHTEALHTGSLESLGTYKLKVKADKPQLTGQNHFYWMSGSQFQEAIKHYPELKKAYHACGPGHTYEKVCEILGDPSRVDIFLSVEDWKQACQGGYK